MNKISVSINVLKIDKSKLIDNKYTNRDGQEVVEKKLMVDLIPLKEKRFIKDTDKGTMWKTHFVVERQSQAERDTKTQSNILGDGIQFTPKDSPQGDTNFEF